MASLLKSPFLTLFPLVFPQSSPNLLHPDIVTYHLFSLLLRRPPIIHAFCSYLSSSHLHFPSRIATPPFSILRTPPHFPSLYPILLPLSKATPWSQSLSTSISYCSSFTPLRCCLRSHCHCASRRSSLFLCHRCCAPWLLFIVLTALPSSSVLRSPPGPCLAALSSCRHCCFCFPSLLLLSPSAPTLRVPSRFVHLLQSPYLPPHLGSTPLIIPFSILPPSPLPLDVVALPPLISVPLHSHDPLPTPFVALALLLSSAPPAFLALQPIILAFLLPPFFVFTALAPPSSLGV